MRAVDVDAGRLLVSIVERLAARPRNVRRDVAQLRRRHPSDSKRRLAERFAAQATRRYAMAGAASALPSVIPVVGTMAQLGLELAAVLGDIPYMLRQFACVMQGIAVIYGDDSDRFDSDLFMQILGYWCKALKFVRKELVKRGSKLAGKAIDKFVTREMVKRINHFVGRTVVTKYGTKRGFVALGKAAPFGVGVITGSAFNWMTMHGYNKACIAYFEHMESGDGETLAIAA